jgi:hypothetical protein
MNTLEKPSRCPGEAGEVSNSVATERRKPEQDPAIDLLGKEAVMKLIWWRRKRAYRGAIRPWWRRRSSPEASRITG